MYHLRHCTQNYAEDFLFKQMNRYLNYKTILRDFL